MHSSNFQQILMKFSRRLRKSGPESIRDALVQLEPEHAPLSPGLLFPQSGKSRGSPTADFGGRTNDSDVADPDLISDALREDGDEKFEFVLQSWADNQDCAGLCSTVSIDDEACAQCTIKGL